MSVRRRPRLTLLLLPWAGGRPDAYSAWDHWLPRDVEPHGISYPTGDRACSVPQVARELAAHLPPGPLALFGHSLGALVAFELARELRRSGAAPPVLLAVSGEVAPHLPRAGRDARTLDDAGLLDEVRGFGGTPEALLAEEAAAELLLPGLRRDLELASAYEYSPEPPLDVPVVAFAGLADTAAPPPSVAAWDAHTCSAFELHRLPGNHFFLLDAEPVVATFLADALDGA